jgi:hypothetical protein
LRTDGEKNIWTRERGSDRRLEKNAKLGAYWEYRNKALVTTSPRRPTGIRDDDNIEINLKEIGLD